MAETNKPPLPSTVTFHYVKSSFFRVIHADGIIGCVTPRSLIHYAIFSERQAIPQTITQNISQDGVVGEAVARTGKEGIVREMEADVMMSLEMAKSFHQWLGDRVKELEAAFVSAGKQHEDVS